MLHNPRLIFEVTALQSGIFLLDAATLWCTGRAVGLNVDVGSAFMSFILASRVATLSPIPSVLAPSKVPAPGYFTSWAAALKQALPRHLYCAATARLYPLAADAAGPVGHSPRSRDRNRFD